MTYFERLRAYDLRVEYRTAPLGIVVARPRFDWRLRSLVQGDRQTAYRIIVRPEFSDQLAWDSGWVEQATSVGVEYLGTELLAATSYSWTLRLRDASGEETDAEESTFETGLARSDIAGEWVSRDPNADRPFERPFNRNVSPRVRLLEPVALLRKEFVAPSRVRRARLRISARGIYRPFINGLRVGDQELAPGWTDYNDWIPYQTHDVTDMVHIGRNALGIALADGWWNGFVGFDARHHGAHYGDHPEAWAQLDLEYDDSSSDRVATDATWVEASASIRYSDLLMGEFVDSRSELTGWSEVGGGGPRWAPVVHHTDGLDALEPMIDEPIRSCEQLPALSVCARGSSWIVDFGQNLVGRVRFTVRGQEAGTRIQLRHGEDLDQGALYTENLRSVEATDVFITNGTPVQEFEPWFTVHGFRYVEISGIGGPLHPGDLTAVVLRNDVPWTGKVVTSSQDLNQLEKNIRWSQRGNFVAVPTDCPQRDERLGWTADAQVFLPTAALNADVASFFTRWMRDVRYSQTTDGSFPLIAPTIAFHKRKDSAPGWGDAGVLIPWQLYRSYGDRRVLRASLPSMIRWIDFIEQHNPDLIWRRRVGPNYGDWLEIGDETSKDVLATAYFAHSAELLGRAAAVLGELEIAAKYSALAEEIKAAFASEFVDVDGVIRSDTQTAYALALEFRLLPTTQEAQTAVHLVRALERNGGLLTTGFLGAPVLCAALTRVGRSDLAYGLVETDRYPSWLYSVRLGATTIWERWDAKPQDGALQNASMNSFNHYAFGSVGAWLYNSVVGIDQTEASVAYSELLIAPRIDGSVTWASGTFDSPRGLVECSWRNEGGEFVLDVTVPPGSTARVVVPGEGARAINAGSGENPVVSVDGVFSVGSGRFSFESSALAGSA